MTAKVDVTPDYSKELVQLARLALTGRRQDIEMYVRRIARKASKEQPEVAESLSHLLSEGLTRQSPLRGEATSTIPVDRDSRLELMRVEMPEDIDVHPFLPDDELRMLQGVVDERTRQAELLRAGLTPTKTLLFTGPPGVGKTISAKWIAKKLNRPLLTLDLSAVMSSYLGRTGTNVRYVLDYAKSTDCVLLLDELDAIAKRRDDGSEIGELKRLVTVLLQEIDDWPPSGLLIAATNHASLLDPAVWRRFEIVVQFDVPTEDVLRNYAARALEPLGVSPAAVHALAAAYSGGTLAELEHDLTRIHRLVVLEGNVSPDGIRPFLTRRVERLETDDRINLAVQMVNLGFSQREVAELLHVSRDTIRSRLPNASSKRGGKNGK